MLVFVPRSQHSGVNVFSKACGLSDAKKKQAKGSRVNYLFDTNGVHNGGGEQYGVNSAVFGKNPAVLPQHSNILSIDVIMIVFLQCYC